MSIQPSLSFLKGFFSPGPLFFFNRRLSQTSADINLIFYLADPAKEKQHALRAKNKLDNCPYEAVSRT